MILEGLLGVGQGLVQLSPGCVLDESFCLVFLQDTGYTRAHVDNILSVE